MVIYIVTSGLCTGIETRHQMNSSDLTKRFAKVPAKLTTDDAAMRMLLLLLLLLLPALLLLLTLLVLLLLKML